MKLGAFSISLSVKNIEASKVFYQKMGFEAVGGDQSQHWLILQNGDHKIGLFQGMFEGNMLTFNPGWDQSRNTLESFTDVRDLLKEFELQGINIVDKSIHGESGPSHISLQDPDGNRILIDQHI
ncbi:VOC family protein [Marinomonas sp. RSW2]|uniref:VOC family protein n=1 Tax=Marinomonas maritima TaxID=2940935 RepID=A0ABT5WHF6_9GAMM|nr:VOC family protein [Marinomonas maritima]MDE8604255.1 VOC family protein [Marinomonas maritima]